MNVNDSNLLAGILRSLVKSNRAISIQDYADDIEAGQVDADRIGAHF